MSNYDKVLSPVRIRNKILRNRVISLPMMPFALADDKPRPTEKFMEHFIAKAEGGAALVAFSGMSFLPQTSTEDGRMDFFNYSNIRPLSVMVDRIHAAGALVAYEDYPGTMELAEGYTVSGGRVLGAGYDPDALTFEGKVMTPEIMERFADRYADIALRAKELGFDALLMHFSHDTVGQFLNPRVNKRTDEYGGSLENRWRFPMMIIDRVREKVGNDMILWLRTIGVDVVPGGFTLEDTIKAAKMLEGKVDILEVSEGGPPITKPWEIVEMGTDTDYTRDHQRHRRLSRAMKDANIHMQIMAVGGYQDPDEMEDILETGDADLIGVCRGLLADEDLAKKLYAGKPEEIVPCIKCLKCIDTPLHIGCSVNPRYGREYDLKFIKPASSSKKVAIVGGGPAGMAAAITAAHRGHDVTLFERENYLGGRLLFADKMPFKKSVLKYKNYLIDHLKTSGAKVELGVQVTKEQLLAGGYDQIILAVGADNRTLPVSGLENAVFASDIYEKDVKPGKRVAIIGGGASGCETALYLAQQGHEVSVIECAERLCMGAHIEYARVLLYPVINNDHITTFVGAKVTKAENGTVFFEKDGNELSVDVDTIVLSVGMVSRNSDVMDLWPDGMKVTTIGDCANASDIKYAITSGFDAALRI